MMDITIGMLNKTTIPFQTSYAKWFCKGNVILVVQFANGDTVLDPDGIKQKLLVNNKN